MPWQYGGGGKWEQVYENPSEARPPATSPPVNNTNNVAQTTPPVLTDDSNKDTTESSDIAVGDFIEIEENVLVGELNVIPNTSYKAKTTVLLEYLGKNLTGLYFVDNVTHTFDSSGYTQSMTVSRNGFGSTIKSGNVNRPTTNVKPTQGGLMNGSGDTSRPSASSPAPVTPPVTKRTYTIKSGDTLWAIATKYYGNGSQYTKIFEANRDKIKNANLIYPGQVITIP